MLVKSYCSGIRFLSICLLCKKPDWVRRVCISSIGKLKYLDTLRPRSHVFGQTKMEVSEYDDVIHHTAHVL